MPPFQARLQAFKTLMLREWMQHRIGWIVIATLPTALVLIASLFGVAQIQLGPDELTSRHPGALASTAGITAAVAALTLGLAWLVAMLQSPGLARRDVQDRSIEFWLSLPVSNSASIAATLLVHLVVWPCAAWIAGLAGGLVTAIAVDIQLYGFAPLTGMPWGTLLLTAAALSARVMLGLLLATLWLSPLILGTMAASAWLKRWGVPAVAAVLGIGGLVLHKVYGITVIGDSLQYLGRQASQAFMLARRGEDALLFGIDGPQALAGSLGQVAGWLLGDAGAALAALAAPGFMAALAGGALGFAALLLRRQRGA